MLKLKHILQTLQHLGLNINLRQKAPLHFAMNLYRNGTRCKALAWHGSAETPKEIINKL